MKLLNWTTIFMFYTLNWRLSSSVVSSKTQMGFRSEVAQSQGRTSRQLCSYKMFPTIISLIWPVSLWVIQIINRHSMVKQQNSVKWIPVIKSDMSSVLGKAQYHFPTDYYSSKSVQNQFLLLLRAIKGFWHFKCLH